MSYKEIAVQMENVKVMLLMPSRGYISPMIVSNCAIGGHCFGYQQFVHCIKIVWHKVKIVLDAFMGNLIVPCQVSWYQQLMKIMFHFFHALFSWKAISSDGIGVSDAEFIDLTERKLYSYIKPVEPVPG